MGAGKDKVLVAEEVQGLERQGAKAEYICKEQQVLVASVREGVLLCQAIVSFNKYLLCLLWEGFSAEIQIMIFYLPQTEKIRKALQ